MAQHDMNLANADGAAFRADANNALAALVSNNSGATAPATTFAFQWWADTTTGLLKIRNAANSAWVTVGTLADANLGLQPYDADTLKSDATKALTAGYSVTPYNAGTKSTGTFTPDEANGNQQYCVNGGAFTLAPPTNSTTIILEVLNNGSAGAITTSGFTKVSGSFTTTDTHKFVCNIVKTKNYSLLQIQALQ